jgi:hypothetical protein
VRHTGSGAQHAAPKSGKHNNVAGGMARTGVSEAHEQRCEPRYPLDAPCSYRVKWHGATSSGTGHTLNMSSNGMLFQAAEPLPIGAAIKVDVDWPARPGARLSIFGHTIRSQGDLIAVVIRKREFRSTDSSDLV